jgi:RNA polymerase sigma-70 factor (ECF subfamily)
VSVPEVRVRSSLTALSADKELVAHIRSGDERAWESLYLAFHEPLWRYAFGYVRSSAEAEEIVQDVFMALWRDRAEWDVSTSVRAWLYGATRNHALNHLRHERIVARLSDAAATEGGDRTTAEHGTQLAMGAPPADAHQMVEARDLDEAVDHALAALPARRRLAMTLRWKHDLGPTEIAHVLGTTPEAVRVLLTRARQDLTELLDRLRR